MMHALALAMGAGRGAPAFGDTIGVRKAWSEGYGVMTAGATQAQCLAAESDFDAVRLWFFNGADTPTTIDRIAVAASAQFGTGYNPVDGAGAAVAFDTYDGLVVPARTAGSSGPSTRPGMACTPILPLVSRARTDGGTLPLAMFRVYSSAGGNSLRAVAGQGAINTQYNSVNQGRILRCWEKTGVDAVTDPSLFVSPAPFSIVAPAAVEFFYRNRGVPVGVFGGSNGQGLGSTSGHAGWCWLATTALSTPARPVSFFNGGFSGSSSTTYEANAETYLSRFRIKVAFYIGWSANDGVTQAAADAGVARAQTFIDLCLASGVVPVIVSAPPTIDCTNATQDGYRKGSNVQNLAKAIPGRVYAFDFDALVTDGGNPARLQASLDSGDGRHGNDACHTLVGAGAQAVLAQIFADKGI